MVVVVELVVMVVVQETRHVCFWENAAQVTTTKMATATAMVKMTDDDFDAACIYLFFLVFAMPAAVCLEVLAPAHLVVLFSVETHHELDRSTALIRKWMHSVEENRTGWNYLSHQRHRAHSAPLPVVFQRLVFLLP